ncbi:uncharacterized protein LOC125423812 [Ziziphus jujuba]|uniref:Uncharacterized protein LOC125423812 n=1 Tax=Ziziphus jujuba TaxID=326968 RepID=A0ABM3ITI8_ZIZJJ|nr:uncharacterized protein LOC125423812 [Ziziphus jujuba]XP_048335186.2 uncharacterized protein LOC125423812 [Ziziphus jujuba]XP_048335187.2 uncharacterized protein LOC125423812 [Ziziphus jujuba]
MGLEELEPIFGEPKVEWAGKGSAPSSRFVLYVHGADPSHLRIVVTDFHSNTWEAVRSALQLEDMRDDIGIGGSWSEFMDYVMASIKSQDAKLILEGGLNTVLNAKLVAQKSKGMPVISISLTGLVGSAASAAIANLSLELYKAFNSIHDSYREEQERSSQLTKALAAEKERNENIQSQLEQYSKRQKLQRISSSGKADVSSLLNNGLENSPEEQAPSDTASTKVVNRVVPAYRRARVRGVLLQNTEDVEDK